MAAAWLRRCCCCCCVEGDGGADSAGLLSAKPSPAKAASALHPAPRADVYAVRHISRFGRAESKETLGGWADEPDDAAGDEGAVSSDPRGAAPAPAPATAVADGSRRVPAVEVAPAVAEAAAAVGAAAGAAAGSGGGGRPAPWQQLLRPQRLPKELAVSTPDLARLPSPSEAGARSAATLRVPGAGRGGGGGLCAGAGGGGGALGASSSCLPRLTQRSSRSSSCTRRTLSDSMESVDLSPEPRSPLGPDVFGAEDTATLARSVGLNMSLYSLAGDGDGDCEGQGQGQGEGQGGSQQPLCSPRRATRGEAGGGAGAGAGQPASADDFSEQPRGSVAFTACYFHKNKKLSIQLIKLENLPPKGRDGVYDVIVRLCILPADKQAKTSKILRGSLSPLAEEDFSFRVKEPVGKAVRFSVFNALLQGKHDAIGHALFNIEDVMNGRTRRYTMKLTHQSQLEPSFGSLQVYLQLSQERLIVDTIQARNLSVSHIFKGARSAEKFNTYIKITFYCAGQKVKSKKSTVVTGDRNPRYEYSCDFKIQSNSVDDCYLVLSVVMKANLRKDITLGRYIFGPSFFTESRDLTPWGRVLLNKEEVHHWFHLYH